MGNKIMTTDTIVSTQRVAHTQAKHGYTKSGRPQKKRGPKGPSKYKPHYGQILICEMEKGRSLTQVAAKFRVALETLEQWGKKYKELSGAIKIGTTLSQAWWEAIGQKNLKSKNFQTGLWTQNMKNRFGWYDRDRNEGTQETKQIVQIYYPQVETKKADNKSAATSRPANRVFETHGADVL